MGDSRANHHNEGISYIPPWTLHIARWCHITLRDLWLFGSYVLVAKYYHNTVKQWHTWLTDKLTMIKQFMNMWKSYREIHGIWWQGVWWRILPIEGSILIHSLYCRETVIYRHKFSLVWLMENLTIIWQVRHCHNITAQPCKFDTN